MSLYEEGQETAFFFPAAEDEYHFCVKRGEEAWEEEEAFTLSFLTVEPHRLLADVDGTVTYPLAGTGMRNGDLIRWTWTTEGNACNRAAATSVVEDGKTVFTLPTDHQYNYLYMCYKVQDSSEFVLFPENYVDIRGGFDITPAVAFVGMQTELTVDVRNWNATDLIKFVPVAQSCESEGMNLEFSEETLNKISVTFQEAGEFKLCYLYSDLEEYLEAAQYTMTVRSLDVQSSVTLLAGVKQTVSMEMLATPMDAPIERVLPSHQVFIRSDLSSETSRGSIADLADDKDYTYAIFAANKDILVVYDLQADVILSGLKLKSMSGLRSVKTATAYISVNDATGPWKVWGEINLTEQPTEPVIADFPYAVARYVKVVVNSIFGALSTRIESIQLRHLANAGTTQVRFVDPSIMNAMQCDSITGMPITPVYPFANEAILGEGVQNGYVMCARIENAWVVFHNVALQVMSVESVAPVNFIAGSKYDLVLTGSNMNTIDNMFLVANSCEDTDSLPTDFTAGASASASITMSTALGNTLRLCYSIGDLRVRMEETLTIVETTLSMATLADVFAHSEVVFAGPAVSTADSIKVVPAAAESCEVEAVATYAMQQVNGRLFVKLALPNESVSYRLCYYFNNEILSQEVFVVNVHDLSLNEPSVFRGVETKVAVETTADLTNAALLLCESENKNSCTEPLTIQRAEESAEEFFAHVLVPADKTSATFTVEIIMNEEAFATHLTMAVMEPAAVTVTPAVVYAGAESALVFAGATLGVGIAADRVQFVSAEAESCNVDASAVLATATLDATHTAFVTLSAPATAVRVCMSFSNSAFVMLETPIAVYGVTSVTPAQATIGSAVSVSFTGVGLADGDSVAFVAAGDACESAQLTAVVAEGAVSVTFTGVATSMDVCYAFQQSPVGMVKQTGMAVALAEPSVHRITIDLNAPTTVTAFVGEEQRLFFPALETTANVAYIAWTATQDCTDLVAEPVYVNSEKEAVVEFATGYSCGEKNCKLILLPLLGKPPVPIALTVYSVIESKTSLMRTLSFSFPKIG